MILQQEVFFYETIKGSSRNNFLNHRMHWEFRHDAVRALLQKLQSAKGRPLPEEDHNILYQQVSADDQSDERQ